MSPLLLCRWLSININLFFLRWNVPFNLPIYSCIVSVSVVGINSPSIVLLLLLLLCWFEGGAGKSALNKEIDLLHLYSSSSFTMDPFTENPNQSLAHSTHFPSKSTRGDQRQGEGAIKRPSPNRTEVTRGWHKSLLNGHVDEGSPSLWFTLIRRLEEKLCHCSLFVLSSVGRFSWWESHYKEKTNTTLNVIMVTDEKDSLGSFCWLMWALSIDLSWL